MRSERKVIGDRSVEFLFDSRYVLKTLLYIFAALTFLHLVNVAAILVFHERIGRIDFDMEGNIPTFYSSCLFLFNALLFYLIAQTCRKARCRGSRWLFFSIVFLFLALDEAATIHEYLGELMSRVIHTGGLFHYAWVIPYILFTCLFGLIASGEVRKLPPAIKAEFLLSAAVFLSGALGLDMVAAAIWEKQGKTLLDMVLYSFEEAFEILGLTLLAHAQVRLLERHLGGMRIRIGPAEDKAPLVHNAEEGP